MPSIGVAKASLGFENFGEISLIGNAKMATPSSEDQVYKRDAYTTRAPKPELEATDDSIKYITSLRDKLEKQIITDYDLENLRDELPSEIEDFLINAFGRNRPPRSSFSDYREELTEDVMALNKNYDPFMFKEIYLDEMTPILRLKYLKDTGAIDEIIKSNSYLYEETTDPNAGNEEKISVIGRILNAATGFGFDFRDQIQSQYNDKVLRDWLITEKENALDSINKTYANKQMPLVMERVADFETGTRYKSTLDILYK